MIKNNVFAAIGDPNRRKILLLLSSGTLTINSLAGKFTISRPAVSKHLKMLEAARLISITDKGRERLCALDKDGFLEIKNWLTFYEQFWNSKLHKLGNLLDSRTKK
ncbi:metalloregulator ArsR/SmtB family transcription factor [soil metagenome]